MGDLNGFNANDHQPMGDYTVVPKADYPAMAVNAEWKKTKAGTGEFLAFTFEIIDGEYKGVSIIARLNLRNPNATAVRIANSELSSICRAVNVMNPNDSTELCNKPLMISVDIEERNDKPGSHSNVIKGYDALGDQQQQAPQQSAPPTEQQKAQATTPPPWRQ